MRITYAQKRGVPEYVEQRIQNVHKAIRKINEEKELYFDDIPYELISAEVTRRMTTRTVTSIMNIDARKMSIDEVTEKEDSELWFLWLYSHMACNVYELYQEADLSDEIFWNTFMDISLWCENAEKEFGVLGIREYEWFYRHIDMILFRFGRLQFESMGEEINIHIPQGCPLIWEDCEKSIEIAKKYFGDNKKFVCHSWLLYPGLDDVIDKNSNIGKFRSHFKVLKTDFNEREAEWRVFGKVLKNVSDYPEETSLQKRIKQYLLDGKTLGNGWAVLK